MNLPHFVVRPTTAAAWLALSAPLTFFAEARADAAAAPARVEITASRLPPLAGEGAAPLRVYTRDEIQRSGAATLHQWLHALPASGGGISDIGQSLATGASGIGLRQMGQQGTLVLLNGRRLAPYPLAHFNETITDLDALPFEAVERVELLAIGGAAVHGSDAVAGILNIITRPDFDGLQMRLTHERSLTSGRFGNQAAALTGGFALPGLPGLPAGRVMAHASLFSRDDLVWREVMDTVRAEAYARSPGLDTLSSYSWPGNRIGVGPVDGCAPSLLSNGLCMYDRYQRFEVVPAAQRAHGLVSATQPLADGLEAFAEALLARTRTQYLTAFQPYGSAQGTLTWGDPSTNAAQTFSFRGLPPGHPLNPTGQELEFRYRFTDAPSGVAAASTQYRVLGGVRGPLSLGRLHFELEAAAGVMGGRTRTDERGWYSASGFREVVGNDDLAQTDALFFQRAYRIGQANDPAVINRLFPTYGYTARTRQVFADARASTTVAQWPAGAVQAVLGAELKHERHTITPSDKLRDGDIVVNGLSASDGARWVAAAFTEWRLPLAPGLQAEAALRADRFGQVATHWSPQASLRWAPNDQWVLRGTVQQGFRAPNLVETATSTKFAFENAVADPKRCRQADALYESLAAQAAALPAGDAQRTLLMARADQVYSAECGASMASITAHNPDLKPETARSVSLGLVFAPSPTTRIALDLWSISRRNEIGIRGIGELLTDEDALPAGVINRLPLANDRSFAAAEQLQYGVTRGALASVVDRFENTLRTRNRGVDLAGSTQLPTPWGRLVLGTDIVYLSELRFWRPESQRWGDNQAGRGHARWRLKSSAALTLGGFEHGLTAVTTSATTTHTDADCAAEGFTLADCRSAGWTRWDYNLRYSAWRGVVLSANVYNLLAKRSPLAWAGWKARVVPPLAEDARGRVLRVAVEAGW